MVGNPSPTTTEAKSWAPPSKEEKLACRAERMHRVNHLQWFTAPSCVPSALILAWLLHGTVPTANLAWFLALVVVTNVMTIALGAAHSWRYRRGLPVDSLERW